MISFPGFFWSIPFYIYHFQECIKIHSYFIQFLLVYAFHIPVNITSNISITDLAWRGVAWQCWVRSGVTGSAGVRDGRGGRAAAGGLWEPVPCLPLPPGQHGAVCPRLLPPRLGHGRRRYCQPVCVEPLVVTGGGNDASLRWWSLCSQRLHSFLTLTILKSHIDD